MSKNRISSFSPFLVFAIISGWCCKYAMLFCFGKGVNLSWAGDNEQVYELFQKWMYCSFFIVTALSWSASPSLLFRLSAFDCLCFKVWWFFPFFITKANALRSEIHEHLFAIQSSRFSSAAVSLWFSLMKKGAAEFVELCERVRKNNVNRTRVASTRRAANFHPNDVTAVWSTHTVAAPSSINKTSHLVGPIESFSLAVCS